MAADSNLTTLNGMFKYIFGDGPVNAIPSFAKLLKAIPFEKAEQLGRSYIFPVIVGDEQGITYNTDGSAFAINAGVSMETKEASVEGVEILTKGTISYKAVAAATSTKQAFANTMSLKIDRMMESHARAAERQLLYGSSGLARVTAKTNNSATSETVTVTDAEWAPGLWAGAKNMQVQFYANDNSTLISSSTDSIFTVYSVDFANKKITVTGTATGITALDGATYTGGGLYIYANGAKGKEMVGLKKIMTTSGSLFGIDNSVYDLFAANQETLTGALDFVKIQNALTNAVARGLQEDVTCYLSPKQWNVLASDAAALRRSDASYNKTKFVNGTSELEFHSANGKLKIEAHPMVKNGDLFMVPLKYYKRVGATDVTFQRPGRKDEFFKDMESYAGYEFRTYSDFAIVCEQPSRCVYASGFTS